MTRITDPDFRLRDQYTPPTLPALPKTGLNLIDASQADAEAVGLHPR